MKKILLLALAVAATVSCKRSETIEPVAPVSPEQGDVIMLSAGTGAAVTMAGTPNYGVRAEFMLLDQIALFAAYLKGEPTARVADWKAVAETDSAKQEGRYFSNWVAACTAVKSASEPVTDFARFGWGTAGLGGVAVDRIYPRANRALAIYAYYPYNAAADTVSVDETAGPQLKISLSDINVDYPGGIIDGAHSQSDILFAEGKGKSSTIDTICRTNILAPLTFKHALAQVNFRLIRQQGAAEAKLVKIEFVVPRHGVMNIVDGSVNVNAGTVADDSLKYVIVDQKGIAIPIPPASSPAETDSLKVLKTNPLMILPLDDVAAKKCQLTLTVHYGKSDVDDADNHRIFKVNLDNANIKGFLAGQKNILTLNLSETGIALEAEIAPWVENTDQPSIDVE